MKTVYLIEDESLVRDFIVDYLKNFTDLDYLGSSQDGQEALRQCLELKPDLVIADIRLPQVNGLEILAILKRKLPDTKVLIFTATVNPHSIRVAINGGVDGFVEKAGGLESLRNAIATIGKGGRFFSPHVEKLIASFMQQSSQPGA